MVVSAKERADSLIWLLLSLLLRILSVVGLVKLTIFDRLLEQLVLIAVSKCSHIEFLMQVQMDFCVGLILVQSPQMTFNLFLDVIMCSSYLIHISFLRRLKVYFFVVL